MNQQHFIEKLEQSYKENLETSKRKNSDYASNVDAFKNFRGCESFGLTVEQGIMVRMSDKFARIGNLLNKKGEVKDESISDTLSDLANYAMILKVYIESKNEKPL